MLAPGSAAGEESRGNLLGARAADRPPVAAPSELAQSAAATAAAAVRKPTPVAAAPSDLQLSPDEGK